MSALLQEMGFDPDDIRVVLNERATTDGIMERLEWLVGDSIERPIPGAEADSFPAAKRDTLEFYYSGHGAQIPAYGPDETDHVDECLVPWDFDGSRERAFTDDQFLEFYSQLPYRARFVSIFDCCHSGGLPRSSPGVRVKGVPPPDDVQHRAMKWDSQRQHWVWRQQFAAKGRELEQKRESDDGWVGRSGAMHRLGRATPLRWAAHDATVIKPDAKHDPGARAPADRGPLPFMPIILQACGEQELAYEHVNGGTSHGAFTFMLDWVFRRRRGTRKRTDWDDLVADVAEELGTLGYRQTPCVFGPTAIREGPVPFSL